MQKYVTSHPHPVLQARERLMIHSYINNHLKQALGSLSDIADEYVRFYVSSQGFVATYHTLIESK